MERGRCGDCGAAFRVLVLREAKTASGVIGNALLPSPLYIWLIWLYKYYFILQSRDNRNSIVFSARENVPSRFRFVQSSYLSVFVNMRGNASAACFVPVAGVLSCLHVSTC